MTDYFSLLDSISKEFCIKRGIQESESSWMSRVIYSFLGQTGYSSLWDIQEDLQPASITHFKRRIESTLESLLDIYPEMISAFSLEYEQQSNEIFRVFKESGTVYHQPNRLVAPQRKVGVGINNIYLRGNTISEKRYVSGLGCYYPVQQEAEDKRVSLSEMFLLQKQPLFDTWKGIVSQALWSEYSGVTAFQYLRLKPPFGYGYWKDTPDLDDTVSLARRVIPGATTYYLYRAVKERMLVSQLPAWMTAEYDYRHLSNACLYTQKTLPPSTYSIDGDVVYLHIAYLYPPEELNLIRLYSWPNAYIDYPNDFRRIMSTSVFEDIKSTFETTGYQFVEE